MQTSTTAQAASALQRPGGVAALAQAAAYAVGIVLFSAVLVPAGYGAATTGPERAVALLVEHRTAVFVVSGLVYVVCGATLVVLALALGERLRAGAPALAPVATALGLVWAGTLLASAAVATVGGEAVVDLAAGDPEGAASLLLAVSVVQDALGGGTEVVGGLWVLLVSAAARRGRPGSLPRPLGGLGAVVGVAGVLTLLPALEVLTAVFGLGAIAWFAGVGVVLVREAAHQRRPDRR